MPFFGRPNITKLTTKRKVDGLIKALDHPDDRIRKDAAYALEFIGDIRAIDPLIARLGDTSHVVRLAAALTLALHGDRLTDEPELLMARLRSSHEGDMALEVLTAALQDEADDVRQAASEALGRLGDARAVEPLVARLGDKHEKHGVRKAAGEALGRLGDAHAVEPLIAHLQDEWYDAERTAAITALGQIGDARAVAPLMARLREKREGLYIHQAAITALGQIGDARAVEPLIAILTDNNLRRHAVEALGQIGDARAVKPLWDIQYYQLEEDEKRCIAEVLKKLEATPEGRQEVERFRQEESARQRARDAKLPNRYGRYGTCRDCGRSIHLAQATMRRLWAFDNEAYQYHCPHCYKDDPTNRYALYRGELLGRDGKGIIDQMFQGEWRLGG
jgi:HEAT repeat protein